MFDRDSVKGLIVNATAPASVLLLDEEHRQGEGAMAETNEAGVKHRLHLVFEFHFLTVRVSVRFNGDGFGTKMNMVGYRANRG